MKLSKRQLKRIIREEYSRLKRRGLIRETNYWWKEKGRGAMPWSEKEWTTVPQEERDAYMDWRWSDDDDDDLRGDEGEEYDQERVDRMIMFLDDIMVEDPELEYDEDAVFHALQGEFADASEEEIAEAMASF